MYTQEDPLRQIILVKVSATLLSSIYICPKTIANDR